MENCAICERIKKLQSEGNPALIHEFAHSYLVVGDHQFFPGYCVLLFKEHVRELHELDPALQDELNRELMQATHAVVKAFKPWKVNHACLGNTDEHIHWHIVPRYLNDPDHKNQPWLHAGEFHKHKIGLTKQIEVSALIRKHL